MRDSAEIRLKDGTIEIRFRWMAFDGDDCFNDFHIDVTSASGAQQFSFGPCAVNGLRKLSKFFRDGCPGICESGFRNPDIRLFDILRADGDYRLHVHFEGSGLSEEIWVRKPAIELEDEFLAEY